MYAFTLITFIQRHLILFMYNFSFLESQQNCLDNSIVWVQGTRKFHVFDGQIFSVCFLVRECSSDESTWIVRFEI